MKKILGCICVLFLFSSCNTVNYNRNIKFVSSPPGAKIELDGYFIGETPFEFKFNTEKKYNMFEKIQEQKMDVLIIAYPNPPIYKSNKLYRQEKRLNFYLYPEEPDSFDSDPLEVYFDMGYREVAPETLQENYNYNYDLKR